VCQTVWPAAAQMRAWRKVSQGAPGDIRLLPIGRRGRDLQVQHIGEPLGTPSWVDLPSQAYEQPCQRRRPRETIPVKDEPRCDTEHEQQGGGEYREYHVHDPACQAGRGLLAVSVTPN
jgi:hypothetical protein